MSSPTFPHSFLFYFLCIHLTTFMFFGEVLTATPPSLEICEEEDKVNVEYCPLRPGANDNMLYSRKEAFTVCEEDVIPPCSETIFLEDKKQTILIGKKKMTGGPSTTPTTTPSTTTALTSTTTTTPDNLRTLGKSEICPLCHMFCDEERSRCDLSENIQTSKTMFEGELRIQISSSAKNTSSSVVTKTEAPALQTHHGTKNISENGFPQIFFDVLRPPRKKPSNSDESQVEMIPDMFWYYPGFESGRYRSRRAQTKLLQEIQRRLMESQILFHT